MITSTESTRYVLTDVKVDRSEDLLLGFFAHTMAEGGLGSPAPDSLMADTLNSYSHPSVTSFTAYLSPEGRAEDS